MSQPSRFALCVAFLSAFACGGSTPSETPTSSATAEPTAASATPTVTATVSEARTPTSPSTPAPTPTDEPTDSGPRTPRPTPVPTPTGTPAPTATQGDVGSDAVRPPAGGDRVIVDARWVAGITPDPNPLGSDPLPTDTGPYTTSEELLTVPWLRYHYEDSVAPVEAIIVGLPGFAGGAGGFDLMARSLVGRFEGRVEVWALDRRSNLLEDLRGADAAEAAQDIDVGLGYYFEGAPVDGHTFDGFLTDADLPFLSEWGLRLTLFDVNAVISQVPAEHRSSVVFLAGHSLAGTLVQLYAAMDFDGDPGTTTDAGYNQIAGLVLLDGGSSPGEAQAQRDYERAVAQVRASDRFVSFPGLTPDVHALLDLFGMAAVADPTGEAPVETIRGLEGVNTTFLDAIFGDHRYTNRGALGMALDDNFQTVYTEEASVGFLTGGPVEPYTVQGATFYRPAEAGLPVLYGWNDYDTPDLPVEDQTLEEVSHIDDVAYTLHLGPVNFTEWYFPSRLTTDLGPVRDLAVPGPEDWRASEHGLWIFHNAAVDVPVLGFFGADQDEADPSTLAGYKASISQTLRDGSPREDGFEMWQCGGYEHLDVLVADRENQARPSIVLTRLETWIAEVGQVGTGVGVDPGDL